MKPISKRKFLSGLKMKQYRPRLNMRASYTEMLKDASAKSGMSFNIFMTHLIALGWQSWNKHNEIRGNEIRGNEIRGNEIRGNEIRGNDLEGKK